MIRRLTAAALLAGASFAATATGAYAATCPPGTYQSPTGLYNPLTGKPLYFCAIEWPVS